jgi:hypothetical protein
VSVRSGDAWPSPHYALGEVASAFRDGSFVVPARVARHLRSCGWDRESVCDCVLALGIESFHRSVPHRIRRDVWLDIYRPVFRGERMYLKFTVHERDGWFLVLSFCLDGQEH